MSTSRKCLFLSQVTSAFIVWLASAMFADAQAFNPGTDQSWTATTQTVTNNANPFRTTERHVKSGDRTVAKKTVEVPGPDGEYKPYFEVEIETVQESPTFSRSITTAYNPRPDGHEHLTQITEAETHKSDDVSRTLQTTSNADYDGNLNPVERDITMISRRSDSQKTETTVYLPSINGGLAPSMQINERQTQSPNGNTETRKETLVADTNGHWQLYEVRQETVKGDARNRTSDVRVYRRDFEGNLSPISEVITKDGDANGQLLGTTETYSVDVPGRARDQSLHLLQSSTTVRVMEPDRIITEQKVVQPDPGETDLKTIVEKKDIVIKRSSGTEEIITVTAQYPDGYPSVVSVETRKSGRVGVKPEENVYMDQVEDRSAGPNSSRSRDHGR
jgi:hypothetical protein